MRPVTVAPSHMRAPARRRHFHDHPVGIRLGKILGDLPLAERIVKRVVNDLRLNAEARRLIAVDRQRQRRALILLIGRHVRVLVADREAGPCHQAVIWLFSNARFR